jgi:hypothetical protein
LLTGTMLTGCCCCQTTCCRNGTCNTCSSTVTHADHLPCEQQ